MIKNDSSLLVSDELVDQLDLDDLQLKILREKSRFVAINFKKNNVNDALVAKLTSIGLNIKDSLINIEVQANIEKNIEFYVDVLQNKLS